MSNGEEHKKTISSSEFDEYQSLKIVQESKKEIISWARNRLSILTIVIAFLGFIGTNVLTYTVVRALTEEDIKEAQRAVIFAETSAKIVQIKMEKATEQAKMAIEQAEDYSKSIEGLEKEAANIKKSYAKIKAERENVRADADTKIEQLVLQIANLDDRISILAKTSKILTTESGEILTTESGEILLAETGNNAEQKVRERFKELQTAQTTLKKDATAKQTEFEENGLYEVVMYGRKEIYAYMQKLGFLTDYDGDNIEFIEEASSQSSFSLERLKTIIHAERAYVVSTESDRAKAVYIIQKIDDEFGVRPKHITFRDIGSKSTDEEYKRLFVLNVP